MLLVESNCFLLDRKNIISENKSTGQMVLRGTFQRANETNANQRIYRKPLLEREVNKLMPLIKENRLLGELDHPENEVVRLQNASHMVTDLKWDGNDVIGECVLLNTPAGLTAQTLVRDGVRIGISSRGLGTLTDIGESVKEVNDDFDMRTFDLVADPSTRGAFPGLQENKNYIAEGRAVVESAKKKALSERAFVVGVRKALGKTFDDPKLMVNEAMRTSENARRVSKKKRGIGGESEKRKGPNRELERGRKFAINQNLPPDDGNHPLTKKQYKDTEHAAGGRENANFSRGINLQTKPKLSGPRKKLPDWKEANPFLAAVTERFIDEAGIKKLQRQQDSAIKRKDTDAYFNASPQRIHKGASSIRRRGATRKKRNIQRSQGAMRNKPEKPEEDRTDPGFAPSVNRALSHKPGGGLHGLRAIRHGKKNRGAGGKPETRTSVDKAWKEANPFLAAVTERFISELDTSLLKSKEVEAARAAHPLDKKKRKANVKKAAHSAKNRIEQDASDARDGLPPSMKARFRGPTRR